MGVCMTRILDVDDNFTSASAPTIGGTGPVVTGSIGAPELITVSGISVIDVSNEMIFIAGSGGAIDITADPQIEAATATGSILTLFGTSDVDTITLENGNGLKLNGSILMDSGKVLSLVFDGVDWSEVARNE